MASRNRHWLHTRFVCSFLGAIGLVGLLSFLFCSRLNRVIYLLFAGLAPTIRRLTRICAKLSFCWFFLMSLFSCNLFGLLFFNQLRGRLG